MNCPRCGEHVSVPRFDGRCTACGNEYLQPFAVRCLKQWSFTTWPDHAWAVPSNAPTQGFYTGGKKGPYVVGCKRSLHEGVYASFSKTLVGAARPLADNRATLLLFVGPGPYTVSDAVVFDARRVVNQADTTRRTTVDSKRERDVPIFDVSPVEHGCPLGDYLGGRKRLPGPVEDGTSPTTLRMFDIEPEGVSSA